MRWTSQPALVTLAITLVVLLPKIVYAVGRTDLDTGRSGRQAMKTTIDGMDWLEAETRRLIAACRSVSVDGTPVYSPDASGNFVGTWTRDIAYMTEGCPGAVPSHEVAAIIHKLFQGQLPDGTVPNKYMESGRYGYAVKGCGNKPPTDNPQFLVKLVYQHCKLSNDHSMFRQYAPALEHGLMSLPMDTSNCLVWIDPDDPHSGYGYTDAIAKSGCELFTSVLLWEARLLIAKMYRALGDEANAERQAFLASQTRSALSVLWDENSGAFFAATQACKQIDIWGSAYAVKVGIVTGEQAESISRFLARNYDLYIQEGMARHIIEPDGWNALLVPMPTGNSQNGGYWGVPCGWIARAISLTDPAAARLHLESMIRHYKDYGVYEWENGDERCNLGYVAGAAQPLADARWLADRESGSYVSGFPLRSNPETQ